MFGVEIRLFHNLFDNAMTILWHHQLALDRSSLGPKTITDSNHTTIAQFLFHDVINFINNHAKNIPTLKNYDTEISQPRSLKLWMGIYNRWPVKVF